jgi:hypothetical protein
VLHHERTVPANDPAVLHNASDRLAVFGYNAFKFQRLNVGGLAPQRYRPLRDKVGAMVQQARFTCSTRH